MVETIGSHAVRLDTTPGVHPVYHVSLLKHARTDPLPSQRIEHTEPPPISAEQIDENHVEGEYVIERILQHRRLGRGYQLEIEWRGHAVKTWEPRSNLQGTEALEIYEQTHDVPWITRATEGDTAATN